MQASGLDGVEGGNGLGLPSCGEARRSVEPSLKKSHPSVYKGGPPRSPLAPIPLPSLVEMHSTCFLPGSMNIPRHGPIARPIRVGQDADELAVGTTSTNQAHGMSRCWISPPSNARLRRVHVSGWVIMLCTSGSLVGPSPASLLQGVILASGHNDYALLDASNDGWR